jgi:hypothetical protein
MPQHAPHAPPTQQVKQLVLQYIRSKCAIIVATITTKDDIDNQV